MKKVILPFTLCSILLSTACLDPGGGESGGPLVGDDDHVLVYAVNITAIPHQITIGGVDYGALQPDSKDDNEHLVPVGAAEISVDGVLLDEFVFTNEDEGRGWGVVVADWEGELRVQIHAVEDEGKPGDDDDEQQDPDK